MPSPPSDPVPLPVPLPLPSPPSAPPPAPSPPSDGLLVVRRGPGANCSSIGSAVEMLFLSATVGAAVLGAVMAALRPRAAEDVDAHAHEPPPPPPRGGPREPIDPTEAG